MYLDKPASISYLKDDALDHTKEAYAVALTMDGIPEEKHTNHRIEQHNVIVHDLRGLPFTLQI